MSLNYFLIRANVFFANAGSRGEIIFLQEVFISPKKASNPKRIGKDAPVMVRKPTSSVKWSVKLVNWQNNPRGRQDWQLWKLLGERLIFFKDIGVLSGKPALGALSQRSNWGQRSPGSFQRFSWKNKQNQAEEKDIFFISSYYFMLFCRVGILLMSLSRSISVISFATTPYM